MGRDARVSCCLVAGLRPNEDLGTLRPDLDALCERRAAAGLAAHGVTPASYGDGVADRIRRTAGKVDAFIDTFGADYVELALDLGVEPSRISTVANFTAFEKYGATVVDLAWILSGAKAEGNAAGASAAVLAELADLISAAQLEVPIAATFPLGQVREAYELLASGHVRGKIVLVP